VTVYHFNVPLGPEYDLPTPLASLPSTALDVEDDESLDQ
jgi:hypothetical protein